MPWARGYRAAQTKANTCLFIMIRTKEREHMFKWAGPANQVETVLIALKRKKIQIDGFEDLAGLKIGVVKDDVAEIFLRNHGIPKRQMLYSFGEHAVKEILFELNTNVVDLWAIDSIAARYMLKRYGYDSWDYRIAFRLESGSGYFAFSKDTPDSIIAAFRRHLDAVMRSPLYQEIQSRYLAGTIFP
jgi:polar amino acid transport system substrate-binding protein